MTEGALTPLPIRYVPGGNGSEEVWQKAVAQARMNAAESRIPPA